MKESAADSPIARVLFVCLGNICRSPMAEGAMRCEVERRGLAIDVDSAGTGGWHAGDPPDRRAQATALRHGVGIGSQRARQVTAADFDHFTHVVAMDLENFHALGLIRPERSKAELVLMLDHLAGREGQGVTDPYYGGDDGFEAVWADIEGAVRGLADRLEAGRRVPGVID